MNKEFDPKENPIEFSDTKMLVEYLWDALTTNRLPAHARISKDAFYHEVASMIDSVREYSRDITLQGLSAMSPEQFRQLLDVRSKHATQVQLRQDELELLSKPGDTIKETLEAKDIHLLDFALAMSRLPDEINDIINGITPINETIANQLEQVLGVEAQFWLNMEALYREKLQKLRFEKLKP